MLNLHYVDAPCGAGKTFAAIGYIGKLASLGTKVLVVQPSCDLIDQTMFDIGQRFSDIRIRAIHSKNEEGVIPLISKHFKDTYEGGEILLITHAAFERISYFQNKADWTVIYDEAPQADWSKAFNLCENKQMLLDLFEAFPDEDTNGYIRIDKCRSDVRDIARNINDDEVIDLFSDAAAHSGDPERSNRLIMNTHSGDHEHRLARA